MPESALTPCSYWVVRYTTNLLRDEWINVGVLLFDPAGPRFGARFLESSEEFSRLRRLQPNHDERLLRGLQTHFQTVVTSAEDPAAYLADLAETLSNAIQLSPDRGVLTEDFESELDRLYRQHVAPPHASALDHEQDFGRAFLRSRLNDVFRRTGLAGQIERQVAVDEFTYQGDPLRIDFAYRRRGTRGFVHTLSMERDAAEAKIVAYTAERIRRRLASSDFTVVTDARPDAKNERYQFVAKLLADVQVNIVPVAELESWVERLRLKLLQ
jgi:hypothetical protein